MWCFCQGKPFWGCPIDDPLNRFWVGINLKPPWIYTYIHIYIYIHTYSWLKPGLLQRFCSPGGHLCAQPATPHRLSKAAAGSPAHRPPKPHGVRADRSPAASAPRHGPGGWRLRRRCPVGGLGETRKLDAPRSAKVLQTFGKARWKGC